MPSTTLFWRASLGTIGIIAWMASVALAIPPHRQGLKKYYGPYLAQSLHQCAICHQTKDEVDEKAPFDPEAPPHNPFGIRLKQLGEQLENASKPNDIITRLRLLADEDSDGDGVSNEIEVLLGRHPGRSNAPPTTEELSEALRKRSILSEWKAEYDWEPFRRVSRPQVPFHDAFVSWADSPIDSFLADGYVRHGLRPNSEATRHVLLRRLFLDLIGLPPTAREVELFVADDSPDAYDRIVDRLLASPRHGERWGRHWMDIWRYSDWAGWTDGGQIRDSQPHIWRWRDWIIDSVNSDKGYDQMIREMLAADELLPDNADALRATGFLVRNYKMLSRETWMQDTIEHTSKAFLGLTMNCARCHDHVYDPITQAEYYRFRAIFEPHQVRLDRLPGQPDVKLDGLARAFDADLQAKTFLFIRGDDRNPDTSSPMTPGIPACLGGADLPVADVPLPVHAYFPALDSFITEETLAAARSRLAQTQSKLTQTRQASIGNEQTESLELLDHRAAEAELRSLEARIAADRARFASPPPAEAKSLAQAAAKAEREEALAVSARDLAAAERTLAELQQSPKKDQKKTSEAKKKREEAAAHSEKARAAALNPGESYTSIGTVYPSTSSGRRSALARWLSNRDNPLSGRVAVNHLWQRHFGRGLVESTFDFGQNGKPPTHPALLDWLAAELMESASPDGAWSTKHLHRMIVTSRAYRLDSNPHSSASVDPENRFHWRANAARMEAELVRDSILYLAGDLDGTFRGPDIDHKLGMSVPRRSLYFRHAPEKQMTFLKLFDGAAATECYERKVSVVPQQALALANSELVVKESRRLARELSRLAGADDIRFVQSAFEEILARPVRADEVELCVAFLADRTSQYKASANTASGTSDAGDVAKPGADAASRARENLVHVLFNHNDFVTVR